MRLLSGWGRKRAEQRAAAYRRIAELDREILEAVVELAVLKTGRP